MKRLSTDAEYLDSGKLILDADGIPFEPAPKDYVDQRVPIDSFTGTGSPEGKVTAPVGSIYTDSAATNGAIRWIKSSGTGNTGWRVEYGDTGWRNISSALLSTWSGTVTISRTQNTVTVLGTNIRPASTGTTGILDLPVGFRPSRTTAGAGDETESYLSVFALGYSPFKIEVRKVKTANSWVSFSITYVTRDDWPTSLPGTPV